MDAAEDEQDIQLQRSSPELLADLQSSLKPFLWKTSKSGKTQIRRRVRVRETDRLVNLLEPFQELPQLLDPHLDKLVPVLADALIASLQSTPSGHRAAPTQKLTPQLLTPLSNAICRLLYTFCKIRSDKVIVRFFSTETRHLELLLFAIENGNPHEFKQPASDGTYTWSWEERYIVLLWLSQLLLAPFDLATISSGGASDIVLPSIPGLAWPENVPGVTLRVVPLSICYLSSAGKERDAAKVLLVRVAMRKDMQELGMLRALVRWALSRLRPSSDVEHSTYSYIGVLSFLAGVLASSTSTADMDPYLSNISHVVQYVSVVDNPVFKTIHASAVARKTIIKVLRTIAVLDLRDSGDLIAVEKVENIISHLLESLADSATPVRLAASKAFSVITEKLHPDMAAQVIEAVLDSLKQNVLWTKRSGSANKTRDLSRVNPLEWHGLILTLSHLLYRRSAPTATLTDIISALLTGLSFEQRSTSGASIGTNVRDAACFGIWALARRYSTNELLELKLESGFLTGADNSKQFSTSVLQTLATELVVSASLDPAGNIRRGSSAALQELIGRHPNTIDEGISVVQVVDYHAVALRSRAVQEVAPRAASLSSHYHEGLMDALLGWRGTQDGDASARRNAAAVFGELVWMKGIRSNDCWTTCFESIGRVENQIQGLASREVEERHGLLLCLTAVIDNLKASSGRREAATRPLSSETTKSIIRSVIPLLTTVNVSFTTYRRPELIAEATSCLLTAVYFILRRDCVSRIDHQMDGDNSTFKSSLNNLPQPSLALGAPQLCIARSTHDIDEAYKSGFHPNKEALDLAKELLSKFLRLNDSSCVDAVADAAADLLLLLPSNERGNLISGWNTKALESGRASGGQGKAYLHAIFRAFPVARGEASQSSDPLIPSILETLNHRWATGHDIETRATILQCLAQSSALWTNAEDFVDIIADGLEDYTTNSRGDVGSIVRIEAAKAAEAVWADPESAIDRKMKLDVLVKLFGKVLKLAVEKLDRVRAEGQKAVAYGIRTGEQVARFRNLPSSSQEYFRSLLDMMDGEMLETAFGAHWRLELFEGYVTSADTGAEDVVRASRAALAAFCEDGKEHTDLVCKTLFEVATKNIENDRVLVPTMEVMSFLFDVQILQRTEVDWHALYILVQKAHYKTGNIRKLEAAVKLYGGLTEVYPEPLAKLSSMLLHPFPRVRNLVAEELFVAKGVGKGVNWVKAGKVELGSIRKELGLVGGK